MDITALYEKKVFSQNGEDGILEHILKTIGITNRIAVEFGVGDGTENNTRYLADHLDFNVFWFDLCDLKYKPRTCVYNKKLLTPANIVETFESANIPKEFDVLSIDIDGNDYHVRDALSSYRPRVCVLEYNGSFASDFEYIMPHDDTYQWHYPDKRFGCSLKSQCLQANRLGYDLVYCNANGVNAFYIRKDVNVFASKTSEQAFVKLFWA
jgi:hypothetical protein